MIYLCKGGSVLSHEKCQLTIHYDCKIVKINDNYFIIEGFDFRIDAKFETPQSSIVYKNFQQRKPYHGFSNEQEFIINGLKFETFVYTYPEKLFFHTVYRHWHYFVLKEQNKELIIGFWGDDRIPQNYKEMIDTTIKSIKLL